MARMSIDDMVGRDPRIAMLASALGWSRRETVGCLVTDIWPISYDQRSELISERLIDAAAGHVGFAAAMIESELASRHKGGRIRIRGAKERIEYLDHKRAAGREGGLRSAESRRSKSKQTSSTWGSTPQARGNPPVPDPVPASVPDPVPAPDNPLDTDSEPPAALGSREPKAKVHRAPKLKPGEPTADEHAAAMFVLQKLGARSGVAYSGAKEHVRLIVSQLRDGVTEEDLRKVIGYCAIELAWSEKSEMAKYLRPETLFGPKTIARYLDPARAWFAKQPGLSFDARPVRENA